MRVLVCGGRNFQDPRPVFDALDSLHAASPISLLIHGKAPGADSSADRWARINRVPIHAVAAQWNEYGKAAGPMRNQQMLELGPDLVVAFPGSKGTADMVRRAQAAGVRVVEPKPRPVSASMPTTPTHASANPSDQPQQGTPLDPSKRDR